MDFEPADDRAGLASRVRNHADRWQDPARRASAAVFLVLTAYTVLILATDSSRFSGRFPGERLPIETLGAVAAALGSALSFVRYAINSSRRWLFVALGLLVLSGSQIAFGIVGSVSPNVSAQDQVYFWAAGRFVAVAFLLAGTGRASTWTSAEPGRRLPWAPLVGLALISLAAVQTALWALRDRLPDLTTVHTAAEAARHSGALPGLSVVDIALGIAGFLVYLLAAYRFLRPDVAGTGPPPWLPVALVVASFTHIHYLYSPSIFRNELSTGDVTRIGFFAVLLIGLVDELRTALVDERRRARELEEAFERELARSEDMERMDRERTELFRFVTHELAQPAVALRGAVVTLARLRDRLSQEQYGHLIEQMDVESDRIQHLIEEAITVSHVESEGFTLLLRREPVGDLVRQALKGVPDGRPLEVGISPEADGSAVSADRARILQVFRNLLSNANTYSPPDRPVGVAAIASDAEVVFAIRDRGPGIHPQDIPRLFQRFSRLQREIDGRTPGSGLGLFIARRIVEAHGGRIWVESRPGEGSTFSFALRKVVEGPTP